MGSARPQQRYLPSCPCPVLRRPHWGSLSALSGGVVLYELTLHVLVFADNPNLIPTVILLGNFIVPISYVAFLDENEIDGAGASGPVVLSFILGGVLGTVAATLLEYQFVRSVGWMALATVGTSEELAKLLGVVWLIRRSRFVGERYGIVFGAAAGMGFAAFESMGYALRQLASFGGNIEALNSIIVTRGLLAPFGHGTWTAIIVSTLWRELARRHFPINLPVVTAFLSVVLLHALWDYFSGRPAFNLFVPGTSVSVPLIIIGLASLGLLYRRVREANLAST
jgi:protease PrsW